jgi:hypothetical protein
MLGTVSPRAFISTRVMIASGTLTVSEKYWCRVSVDPEAESVERFDVDASLQEFSSSAKSVRDPINFYVEKYGFLYIYHIPGVTQVGDLPKRPSTDVEP